MATRKYFNFYEGLDTMSDQLQEKPALLIIDMVKDILDSETEFPVTPLAARAIPVINSLIQLFRKEGWPVIFPTDAFHETDFIFKSRLKPHSLAGTWGAEITASLDYRPETDLWLPKPRFSAFFGTGLEKILHEQGVTLCAVAGITTQICVLTTVLDALCHDFKAVLLEDCTAAYTAELHETVLSAYRRTPLDPLLRVVTAQKLVEIFRETGILA